VSAEVSELLGKMQTLWSGEPSRTKVELRLLPTKRAPENQVAARRTSEKGR